MPALLRSLAAVQPAIPTPARAVRVLDSPAAFNAALHHALRRARRRVFLSSLYIGPAEHHLLDALDHALRQNTRLRVHLALDYNRTTRPGPDAPLPALLPLLRAHASRLRLSLFRSPNSSGPLARAVPPRFNEGWGTWHPKIYGADDDIIISGANLNTSYFTNRQDRYLHFASQPKLANYCYSFLNLMSSFSYNVSSSPHTDAPVIEWPDPSLPPWKIQSKIHDALTQFQASHRASSDLTGDTVLFPVIQGGQFNIREEERVMSILFHYLASSPDAAMTWTSGYFGLYKPYQDWILKSPASCNIIAAGPKANGFYGSPGLSGLIPEGYTLLEQRFIRAVRAAGRHLDNPVTLSEWERPGWTYHAKGIWLSPDQRSPPIMTMFGSTNLNSRSANLDTELSFVMLTSSHALRLSLLDELRNLRRWAGPWTGADRKVRWKTKAIVGLVGGML